MIVTNETAVQAAREAALGQGWELSTYSTRVILDAAIPHLTDAGQPLGDAGTSRDKLGRVAGRCPACRSTSLFLAQGGHVTCSRLDCPNPAAADERLGTEEDQPLAVSPPVPACTGASDCRAGIHVEGCYATAEPVRPGPARKVLSTTLANLAGTLARQDARDSARRLLAEARTIVDSGDPLDQPDHGPEDDVTFRRALQDAAEQGRAVGSAEADAANIARTTALASLLLPRFEDLEKLLLQVRDQRSVSDVGVAAEFIAIGRAAERERQAAPIRPDRWDAAERQREREHRERLAATTAAGPTTVSGFSPSARVELQQLLEVVMDHTSERTAHLARLLHDQWVHRFDTGQPLAQVGEFARAKASYDKGYEDGRTAGYSSGYENGQVHEAIGPRDEMGTPLRPTGGEHKLLSDQIAALVDVVLRMERRLTGRLGPAFDEADTIAGQLDALRGEHRAAMQRVLEQLDPVGTPRPGTIRRLLDDLTDGISGYAPDDVLGFTGPVDEDDQDDDPEPGELWTGTVDITVMRDWLTDWICQQPGISGVDLPEDADHAFRIRLVGGRVVEVEMGEVRPDPDKECACGAAPGAHLGTCPQAPVVLGPDEGRYDPDAPRPTAHTGLPVEADG